MKKLFILVLLIAFLFINTVFATTTTLPANAFAKYQSYKSIYDFVFIQWKPDTNYIYVNGTDIRPYYNVNVVRAKSAVRTTILSDGTLVNEDQYSGIDGDFAYFMNDNSHLYLSNVDILYQNDYSRVFFSAPTYPLIHGKMDLFVPTVAQESMNILVPSVVIMALLMAVKLIPRVLYKVL